MPRPALLMSTSSPPRRSTAASTARSTAPASRRSQASTSVAVGLQVEADDVRAARAQLGHRGGADAAARAGDEDPRAHAVTGSGVEWLGRYASSKSAGSNCRGPLPEAPRPVGPQRRVAPGRVEVPARAAGVPHRALHALVEVGVVALRRVGAHLHGVGAVAVHVAQRVEHVGDLRLDHVDHRRVARARCSGRAARTGWGSRGSPRRGAPAGCPARRRRASCRPARAPSCRPACR